MNPMIKLARKGLKALTVVAISALASCAIVPSPQTTLFATTPNQAVVQVRSLGVLQPVDPSSLMTFSLPPAGPSTAVPSPEAQWRGSYWWTYPGLGNVWYPERYWITLSPPRLHCTRLVESIRQECFVSIN
ncbi:MAG: hypothetical protein EBX30_15000 [Betaproteobacteria bacterium]|nr:hypothetical protein [Betaproteobacteria bacterium]